MREYLFEHQAVVPTYVGVIPTPLRKSHSPSGGPHVCGGDPIYIPLPEIDVSWSPRMWG